MKSTSRVCALAASALCASMLAGCAPTTSGQGESQSGFTQGGTGAQGGTAMSPTHAQCAQFHQMESRRTPSTQLELVDPQLRGMTPEQRERYMQMMREKCGPGVSVPPPRY